MAPTANLYLSRSRQRQIAGLLRRALTDVDEAVQDQIILRMSEALEENNGQPASAFDSYMSVKIEDDHNV